MSEFDGESPNHLKEAIDRIGTHSDGCWRGGPRHWMCAAAEIERMSGEHADDLAELSIAWGERDDWKQRAQAAEARNGELVEAIYLSCRNWARVHISKKFWAVDPDGSAWFYSAEPYTYGDGWYPIDGERVVAGTFPLDLLGVDWSETLTRRPEGV